MTFMISPIGCFTKVFHDRKLFKENRIDIRNLPSRSLPEKHFAYQYSIEICGYVEIRLALGRLLYSFGRWNEKIREDSL